MAGIFYIFEGRPICFSTSRKGHAQEAVIDQCTLIRMTVLTN